MNWNRSIRMRFNLSGCDRIERIRPTFKTSYFTNIGTMCYHLCDQGQGWIAEVYHQSLQAGRNVGSQTSEVFDFLIALLVSVFLIFHWIRITQNRHLFSCVEYLRRRTWFWFLRLPFVAFCTSSGITILSNIYGTFQLFSWGSRGGSVRARPMFDNYHCSKVVHESEEAPHSLWISFWGGHFDMCRS